MKILAAVDLDDELAVEILVNACATGKAMGAEVVDVIHVESVPLRYAHVSVQQGAGETVEERELRLSRNRLETLLDAARDRLSIPVRPLVVSGDPAEQIVAEARRGKFEFVVLGTHRRTGVSRMLMGSIAEEVVRHSPCPVIVVPTGTAFHPDALPVRS